MSLVAEVRARLALGTDHCVAGTKLPPGGRPCPKCGSDYRGECKFYGVAMQKDQVDLARLCDRVEELERVLRDIRATALDQGAMLPAIRCARIADFARAALGETPP